MASWFYSLLKLPGKEHASAIAEMLRRTRKAVNSNGSFKGEYIRIRVREILIFEFVQFMFFN